LTPGLWREEEEEEEGERTRSVEGRRARGKR
jgi:hypothetical protein